MKTPDQKLFLTCFAALVTTAFCFILRALTLPQWGSEFHLTNTQIGEIAGVGLWPFAISIVLFSLAIDKVGYKRSLIFAFACHLASSVLTFMADGYTMLYIATFIMAIGNGTVEAVVNPVVASLYPANKTKWLTLLHAAWPVGLVLGGLFAIGLEGFDWRIKMGLLLIPTLTYGLLMLPLRFPLNERVKAGVTYFAMLKEVGVGGALVIVSLIVFQLGVVFEWSFLTKISITLFIVLAFAMIVRTMGPPLFLILLLIMIPLATTELGTDSWISDLMSPQMQLLGIDSGWILIYTAAIMALLRIFAGTFFHKISPLALLAVCSAVAALGLFMLSVSTGAMILIAATVFALGKTFFWPTMLGVVAEQFPKGGALTLNITGGVGMIGAGVVGAVFLGFVQDKSIDAEILRHDNAKKTELHATYITEAKQSIFGDYRALDESKLLTADHAVQQQILEIQNDAKKDALKRIAIVPLGMLVCYVLLMLYFKRKGGYKPIALETDKSIISNSIN